MRLKATQAFASNNKEQAKYYLQRMREHQPLSLNQTVIPIWADLQMDSYKKGVISNVFKVKYLEIADKHIGPIEHIKFCKNERYLALMSKDFTISFWEVSTWTCKVFFKAYHESHAKFYMKELPIEEV
jgi:WD40 repeat protein